MGLSLRLASAGLALTLAAAPLAAQADITFDSLGGTNGSVFTSYVEDGLTVTKTDGDVFVGKSYGNPVPNLFFGPVSGSSTASLEITGGGADFSFVSFDFSANNGAAFYEVRGFSNALETFSLSGQQDISGFATVLSGTNQLFDRVTFDFRVSGTSANFDNFISTSAAVPEPATWAMLILGFAATGGLLRRRRAAFA